MFAPAQHLELAASDVAALCALYPRETPASVKLLPGLRSANWDMALPFGAMVVVAVWGVWKVRQRSRSS